MGDARLLCIAMPVEAFDARADERHVQPKARCARDGCCAFPLRREYPLRSQESCANPVIQESRAPHFPLPAHPHFSIPDLRIRRGQRHRRS
ncbi:MAG: hypothetical protein ACREPX_02075, partial [Rhodanobacteraceae bacterium]